MCVLFGSELKLASAKPNLDAIPTLPHTNSTFDTDSISDVSLNCSITGIDHDSVQRNNVQWYGWTQLPSTPSAPPISTQAHTQPRQPITPRTPRSTRTPFDRNQSSRRESRREGMLACIQRSAKKQRQSLAGDPRHVEADLRALNRGLQVCIAQMSGAGLM